MQLKMKTGNMWEHKVGNNANTANNICEMKFLDKAIEMSQFEQCLYAEGQTNMTEHTS